MPVLSNFLTYIDPGTGSMLFTIIIGVATAAVFAIRGLLIKFKFKMHGGKAEENTDKLPLVIFSDSKRYWNVFGPICHELDNRGISSQYWTMSEDDPALSENFENVKCLYIGDGNSAFAKLNIMNAKVCLATTPGLDVLQWKRSKKTDKYVHIYHEVSDGTMYRMFGVDHYDTLLTTGTIHEGPVRKLEELRNLPEKEVVIVGSTYMDVMMEKLEAFKNNDSSADATDDKNKIRTVLCAPSWGKSSILSKFGAPFIQSLIDTGYKIIVRPHPQSMVSEKEMLDDLMSRFPENDNFSWNFDNDNFSVLNEADVLISDFSSVIFDFAFVFDKPVICADTSYDKSPYDAIWLEGDPWTMRVIDSIGLRLTEDNIDSIKSAIDNVIEDNRFAEGREKARAEAWHNIGNATSSTCDYLAKLLSEE